MNENLTTKNLLNKLIGAASALSLCAVLGVASEARADEPQLELGAERVTAVAMDDYHASTIVRARTPGKSAVTFSAMEEEIAPNAEVVFEIRSESGEGDGTRRWRCVARDNVSECFDKPVRVSYLDDDQRVVLEVRVQQRVGRVPFFANR